MSSRVRHVRRIATLNGGKKSEMLAVWGVVRLFTHALLNDYHTPAPQLRLNTVYYVLN